VQHLSIHKTTEPIKPYTITSVIGSFGFIGTPQKETLFVDDRRRQRKKGACVGEARLSSFCEDDKSVHINAVIAAMRLIQGQEGNGYLWNESMPDAALAIVPVCEQERVPFIDSGSAKILSQRGLRKRTRKVAGATT
jgi:hypothetical protein